MLISKALFQVGHVRRNKMLLPEDSKTKADIAIEFLEVAAHSILYYRSVYPKAIFCLKKKYNTPVYVSRHPEVNAYINESLKTAKLLFEENGLKRVTLIIVDEREEPLEKYCFDISDPTGGETDPFFVKTEEKFRDFLLKISIAEDREEEKDYRKSDKSFRIEINTKRSCSVRLNENPEQEHFPWIEADDQEESRRQFHIFPIKTLETSLLKMNMYVERC